MNVLLGNCRGSSDTKGVQKKRTVRLYPTESKTSRNMTNMPINTDLYLLLVRLFVASVVSVIHCKVFQL